MSRVHDALRRAELAGLSTDEIPTAIAPPPTTDFVPMNGGSIRERIVPAAPTPTPGSPHINLHPGMLAAAPTIRFEPATESHLLDLNNSHETPSEEFRTLRTRLNHLQSLQPLHTIVVTSPSPAEGKTFTAVNLALAQAHLAETSVLLADFDLRRPLIHKLLQVDRSPGISDFLTGQCTFPEALRRVEGMNMYFLAAGSPVKNPLELLNMRQTKSLFEELPKVFNWAIFDTPPLLFSADANLLSTLADGTILVVKIGSTTFDSVTRAMQSLCENNVLGIVANGARASELYSKYTYYYSKAE